MRLPARATGSWARIALPTCRSPSSRRASDILERGFGDRFAAVLVPPWNRIDPEVVARLPDAGFHGLSTFGPRTHAHPVPGIVQCNTHVDLIAWSRDRAFIGVDSAVDRLVAHLESRREGRADAGEATGNPHPPPRPHRRRMGIPGRARGAHARARCRGVARRSRSLPRRRRGTGHFRPISMNRV